MKITIVTCKLNYLIPMLELTDERTASYERGEWFCCTLAILVENNGKVTKQLHSDWGHSYNITKLEAMLNELLEQAYAVVGKPTSKPEVVNLTKEYSEKPKLK